MPNNSQRNQDLESVLKLRAELDTVPAIPIEHAAKILQLSVRTLYRRRVEFEHKRQKGHLYFTLRGIRHHIQIEQYNPTAQFNLQSTDAYPMPKKVAGRTSRNRQSER